MDIVDPYFTLRRQQSPIPKPHVLKKIETIEKSNKIKIRQL